MAWRSATYSSPAAEQARFSYLCHHRNKDMNQPSIFVGWFTSVVCFANEKMCFFSSIATRKLRRSTVSVGSFWRSFPIFFKPISAKRVFENVLNPHPFIQVQLWTRKIMIFFGYLNLPKWSGYEQEMLQPWWDQLFLQVVVGKPLSLPMSGAYGNTPNMSAAWDETHCKIK